MAAGIGMTIDPELGKMLQAVQEARTRFDFVSAADQPELLDAAIHELKAAELRLSAYLKGRRSGDERHEYGSRESVDQVEPRKLHRRLAECIGILLI